MSIEQVFDDARRLADAYNAKLLENRLAHRGKWMAFKLADGSTNSVLYDTFKDARRFNGNAPHIILQLAPDGIRPRAAAAILKFHRGLHDSGMRLGDPDAPQAEMLIDSQRIGL